MDVFTGAHLVTYRAVVLSFNSGDGFSSFAACHSQHALVAVFFTVATTHWHQDFGASNLRAFLLAHEAFSLVDSNDSFFLHAGCMSHYTLVGVRLTITTTHKSQIVLASHVTTGC